MKTILLICSDEEYNDNIEAKLSMQLGSDVLLHIITDEQHLKKVMEQPLEVSAIFVEAKMVSALGNKIKASEIFVLEDGLTDLPEGHISKYAGIQAVLRVLGHKLLKHEGEVIDRDARIIDVVSVCGGSGKTISALGLSKRLSMMGRKVLYVSCEAMQDYYPYLQGDKEYLSDNLIRQMSYITDSTTDMVIGELLHDSFDYMPQMAQITADMKIFEESYYEIITRISKRYLYDYIVVEHGNSLSSEMLKWLSHSERMVVVTRQDKRSVDRTQRFLTQLKGMKGQCNILCGRYEESKPNELNESQISDKYPVCEFVPEMEEVSVDSLIENGSFDRCAEALL